MMRVFYAISSVIVHRGDGLDHINYLYQFLPLIMAVLKSAGLREAQRELVATVNTHEWSNYPHAQAAAQPCSVQALLCDIRLH